MAGSEEFRGTNFEGENYANNKRLGTQSLVTVDVFKRGNGTHFMRVSLRSVRKPEIISRYEVNLDKYTNEADFLGEVAIAGGALAERQCQMYLDTHDPTECAKAAREAAVEVFRRL